MTVHVRELERADKATDVDPLVHYVCCLEPDRSFCGSPVSDPAAADTPASCVVCTDLWKTNRGCPFGRGCTADRGPR